MVKKLTIDSEKQCSALFLRVCVCYFILSARVALAVPEMPITFYGDVFVDGISSNSTSGGSLSVVCGSNTLAVCSIQPNQIFDYVLAVPFSDDASKTNTAYPGSLLEFMVEGTSWPVASVVLTNSAGADILLDLNMQQVSLVIENSVGEGSGVVTNFYPKGTPLELSAPSVVISGDGIRYRLSGFSGVGCIPVTGTNSTVQVVLTNDSTIAWQWETAYRLETLAEPPYGGTITVHPSPDAEGLFEPGQPVQVAAVPNSGFLFREWVLDASGREPAAHVVMQGPRALIAIFDRDANADGLPDEWQMIHFGSYLADRAAPDADPAGSRMTNMEKWIAGLNPNDQASIFRMDELRTGSTGELRISWYGVSERMYRLYTAESVAGPWVRYPNAATEFAGHDADIAVSIAPASRSTFFRLEVRR